MNDDLSTMSRPELVRRFGRASDAGDKEAQASVGAELARRRNAKQAPDAEQPTNPVGRLTLQRASGIELRGVTWTWVTRMPSGSVALLAGREGTGKSTLAATIAAQLTRGTLPGEHEGTPRGVLVSATEDSWSHTIVPRLMAAGADLDMVFHIIQTGELSVDDTEALLTFPANVETLRQAVEQQDIALVVLDPLMSRLGSLDAHKDAEVRQALEPLVAFADGSGVAVLGLIHFNKSTSVDALTAIMGSRAFVAVARSVLVALPSPDVDGAYVLGHAKSNLGPRADTEGYEIEGVKVGRDAVGVDVWTSHIRWTGVVDRSVEDIHEGDDVSAVDEAADWLADFLSLHGGEKESGIVKDAGAKAGHAESTLKRARKRLGVVAKSAGTFPRKTIWHLPEEKRTALPAGVSDSGGTSTPVSPTSPTGPTAVDQDF